MAMNRKRSKQSTDAASICVIYARYSSHNQREESIEQQVAACTEYAARRGYRIAEIYADKAISGTVEARPQFQRMISDADRGTFAHVVTYKVDRFARDRLDSAVYKSRLRKLGITVEYAKEDVPDSPVGILMEGILESQAEFYVANLRQDVIRGMQHNAENALSNGPLPYGYRRADKTGRVELDPAAAPVVQEIYQKYAAGDRPKEIADDLNRRGILTRTGRPWTLTSFQRILTNERYKGIYIFGSVRTEGAIPRIIDDVTFDKVQRRRAKLAYSPAAKDEVYALSGKVFCGKCGEAMVGACGTSKNGTRYYYYDCGGRHRKTGCTLRAVGRDVLEMAVCRCVLNALTDESIEVLADEAESLMREEYERESMVDALRAELADVQKRKANVLKTLEMVASSTMAARLVELEQREQQLNDSLRIEDARSRLFDRDLFVAYLRRFRSGDLKDPVFRQTIIDVYVSRVYVYDGVFSVDLSTGESVQENPLPDSKTAGNVSDGVFDGVLIYKTMLHQCLTSRTHRGISAVIRLWNLLPSGR